MAAPRKQRGRSWRKQSLAMGYALLCSADLYATTDDIPAQEGPIALLDLSLEDLAQVHVSSNTFTLTDSSTDTIPASYTRINAAMIASSGARDLDELLEIYVPGMLSMHHPTLGGRYFSTRGIVSNDTVLMLVNNRVMNERMLVGAQSERAVSMLRDIESIEVIRGPGAAVHGAGALAGVISIKTFNGTTFEGRDVSVRGGVREKFANLEARMGKQIDENNGLFLYYGIDKYEGGDASDSPYHFGSTFEPYMAGEHSTVNTPAVNESARDKFRHKLHLQWTGEDFDVWLRYVRGGLNIAGGPWFEAGADIVRRENQMTSVISGYDQLTLKADYNIDLSDTLVLKTKASYDWTNVIEDRYNQDAERFSREVLGITAPNPTARGYLEREFLTGAALNWTPNKQHQFYLGYEISLDDHARNSISWPGNNITRLPRRDDQSKWSTHFQSLIGEYQLQLGDEITVFTGARIDDHSLIDKAMISPRVALIYTPTSDRSFKWIYSKSIRRSDEQNLKRFDEKDSEHLKYYEFIYDQKLGKTLSSAFSIYYAEHDLISFSSATNQSRPLGTNEFYGADWELTHTSDAWRNQFSVSYIKLRRLKLKDPEAYNFISTQPQGYGSDFTEVPRWIMKLHSRYTLNTQWTLHGSIVSHLGAKGRKHAFAGYLNREVAPQINDGKLLLSTGAEFSPSDNLTFSLNAHNVLGWVDTDFNNRFVRGRADYRPDVASLSFGLTYDF